MEILTKREIKHYVIVNLSYNLTHKALKEKIYSQIIRNLVDELLDIQKMKTIKLILYHILSRIIPDMDILDVHLDRLRDIRKKLVKDESISDAEMFTLYRTIIIIYKLKKLLFVLKYGK